MNQKPYRFGYYVGLCLKLLVVYLWIIISSPVTGLHIVWNIFKRHTAENIVFVNFRRP